MIKKVQVKELRGELYVFQVFRDDNSVEEIPLVSGFKVHQANEILRSLNPDYYVYFKTFKQYTDLVGLINAEWYMKNRIKTA